MTLKIIKLNKFVEVTLKSIVSMVICCTQRAERHAFIIINNPLYLSGLISKH